MLTDSRFISKLLLFSGFIALGYYFVNPALPEKFRFEMVWMLQLFMMLVTFLFHVGLMRAGAKSDAAFIRFFMGATGIKLFLFMVVLIGYALFNKATAVAFIANFFILYLLYTVFEVAMVYKKFSSQRKAS